MQIPWHNAMNFDAVGSELPAITAAVTACGSLGCEANEIWGLLGYVCRMSSLLWFVHVNHPNFRDIIWTTATCLSL